MNERNRFIKESSITGGVSEAVPSKEERMEMRQQEASRIREIERKAEASGRLLQKYIHEQEEQVDKLWKEYGRSLRSEFSEAEAQAFYAQFPTKNVGTMDELRYVIAHFALAFGMEDTRRYAKRLQQVIYPNRACDDRTLGLLAGATGRDVRVLEKLFAQPPVFCRKDRAAYREVDVSPEVISTFPRTFMDEPSAFFEKLRVFPREELDLRIPDSIRDVLYQPYDVTRVRVYKRIFVKRVDFLRVQSADGESQAAERARNAIQALGDPRVHVQEFLGTVHAMGNAYVLSRKAPGRSLRSISQEMNIFGSEAYRILQRVKQALEGLHVDLDEQNIVLNLHPGVPLDQPGSVERLTIIDFEGRKEGEMDP